MLNLIFSATRVDISLQMQMQMRMQMTRGQEAMIQKGKKLIQQPVLEEDNFTTN